MVFAVCTLAQDFLQEQDFPERNLLQRASRTLEELLRFSETAQAWFSFPLDQLKIRKKCCPGSPAPKRTCESEVMLL
jgi:hypothetical protein